LEFEGGVALTLDRAYQAMQMTVDGFDDSEMLVGVEDTYEDLRDLFMNLNTTQNQKCDDFAKAVLSNEKWVTLFMEKETKHGR
jgi:hypothetical protein